MIRPVLTREQAEAEFEFYLGTHRPGWLWRHPSVGPMFVSHRRLRDYKTLPAAQCQWALDSGGFSELSLFGAWETTAEEYVEAVERYAREIGSLDWAAPMDWMCEPVMLAKTGLSVREHQERTVRNLLDLRERAPELPFIPVLQGWALDDYERCIDMYGVAGIDLREEPVVGVGSVCRRQATGEIEDIIRCIVERGISVHAFGVKVRGLANFADVLTSADSMAWSFQARRSPPLPFCREQHLNCANCIEYARRWRTRLLDGLTPQLRLEVGSR